MVPVTASFLALNNLAIMTGPIMSSAALTDGNSVYVKFNTEDEGCKWNIWVDWADAATQAC